MNMILTGQKAFDAVLQVIDQAQVFCYITCPWIGSSWALAIKKQLKCHTRIVVVADYFTENVKSYHILKHCDYRILGDLHDKLIVTENAVVSGSQNFTDRSFFRTLGHYSIKPNTDEEYLSLKLNALQYIKRSKPFDSDHQPIYWSKKDRPLETLPEILVDSEVDGEPSEEEEQDALEPKEPTIEPEETPLELEVKEEEPLPEEPSEESKENIEQAWRLLLGRGNSDS
jgi:hypothetical protein